MEVILQKIITPQFITSIVISIISIVGIILLNKGYKSFLNNKKNKGKQFNALSRVVFEIIRIVIIVIIILVILEINGINVNSMVAGLGIAGAVVGLAVQDPIKDLVMGIHILRDGFFNVGDTISFNGKEGVVINFSLLTTTMSELDTRSKIKICNRDITEVKVLNNYFDVSINLSYNEDIKKVKDVLLNVCDDIAKEDKVDKCEFLGIDKFADSSIEYVIRIYCSPIIKHSIHRKSNSIIIESLERNNIHIPFNQLDVHIDQIK